MQIKLEGGPCDGDKVTVSENTTSYSYNDPALGDVWYDDSGVTGPDGLRIFTYRPRNVRETVVN